MDALFDIRQIGHDDALHGIERVEYDARQHTTERFGGGYVRDCGEGPMTVNRHTFLRAFGVLALFMALLPSLAYANAGVHGGYPTDSDQCSSCHRAHNVSSSIMWTDTNGKRRSALLRGGANDTGEFCYTCHGATAQGADTDVEDGVYKSRASDGAFGTSGDALTGGKWGPWTTPDLAATGVNAQRIKMDCAVCHLVHGTSNYRLLNDTLFGQPAGGYDSAGNPTPFVLSAEEGFPEGGFRLHVNAVDEGYRPSYTAARHAKPPVSGDGTAGPDPAKGMSGWCGKCHNFAAGSTHFHPFNVPLSNWPGSPIRTVDNPLPLAHDIDEGVDGSPLTNTASDWIDCTTCHIAHTPHGNTTAPFVYPALCVSCHTDF